MCKYQKKIVLIGGPSTGKTSVLNELIKRGYCCFAEVSREVILKAKQQGIEQLFLTKPLLFSQLILKGREQQFICADKTDKSLVFLDRGIPDIHAYMNCFNTEYPALFLQKSKFYRYNKIFHFSPWKDIYAIDNERYETFETSIKIDEFLIDAYTTLEYSIANVPFGSVKDRTDFIINSLSYNL